MDMRMFGIGGASDDFEQNVDKPPKYIIVGVVVIIVIILIAVVYFGMYTETVTPVQPMQVQATPVKSIMDSFVKYDKVDRVGADIACYSNPVEFCAEKCLADPKCKSINSWNGGKSCCYKTATDPKTPNVNVTSYDRK